MKTDVEEKIQRRLFELQDKKFRDFHLRLIPTVPPENVIGVRTPALRELSRAIAKEPETAEAFMRALPHRYYEENNLHAFLIESMKDYRAAVSALEAFLPYVDNWATCDFGAPAAFKKHPSGLYGEIKKWLSSERIYTVRFGLNMLMRLYLDEDFKAEQLELASSVKSEEYYVNMMLAWYFATALAKQYKATLPYIEQRRLEKWVHNKTIQKAIESYRISDEQKMYLRSLKIK